MSEYGIYEAKTKLPDLIKQVQQGERVTITNRGRPVVDLVPSASRTEQQAADAIAAITEMRRKCAAHTSQAEYDALRLKGRR